jgi:hypothetical protein
LERAGAGLFFAAFGFLAGLFFAGLLARAGLLDGLFERGIFEEWCVCL